MARKSEEPTGAKKKATGFADFAGLFSDMKMPSFGDLGSFLHVSQRNMEVLAEANRVAMEGAHAYAQRQMEIIQDGFAQLTEAAQACAKTDKPGEALARQLELMQQARERSVANMEELGRLIQKSNDEVVRILAARFAEAVDEIQGLMAKAGRQAP